MGKSTISMVIFNSYVKLPEGISHDLECIEIFTYLACVSYITQYIHVCADGPFTGPQIGVGWGGVGCDSIRHYCKT